MGSDPSLPALEFMLQHVLLQLSRHRSQPQSAPLIVGVQGPQGSGKTFLTTLLRNKLSAEPHNLAVALLSIDDLYLPHEKLVELARSHPDNALLKGRGQPGTHDVPLGTQVLHSLKKINEPGAEPVMLPIFEKSLHGGEGDRLPEGLLVHGPLDVVILEGWCTGFYPTPAEEIERRWTQPVIGLDGSFSLEKYRKEDIFEINKMLESYVGWWELFNTFIQIKPKDSSPYIFIYKWRLEQEQYMKSQNGGKGMSDDEVNSFVDRYIPGYVFFGDGIESGSGTMKPPWIGKGLKITIGERRDVEGHTKF